MNGILFNNDHNLYFKCLKYYRITFKDGAIRYTRAKCRFDAEENVRWFGGTDKYDDIVLVEELYNLK